MNTKTVLLLLFALTLAFTQSKADAAPIQKWTDSQGKTHYGGQPPKGAESQSIKKAPAGNPSQTVEREEVVLYSTSWCGYCKKARAYMLDNGITYTELDIEKNRFAKADYERAGGVGVPFLVKGDRVLGGFRASSYDRFFAIE